MSAAEKIDVSVCIVNWNTRALLCECIESIAEKTSKELKYEVIVVDNASGDSSAGAVKARFPWCTVIESGENLGFVKANNAAVKAAGGKFVLYLNPDTRLVTDALRGMRDFLEENPDFGAVGCRLLGPDGDIQRTCASAFPTPFNEFCRLFFLNRAFPWLKVLSSREIDYWDHRDSRRVDCLSGACMMVRKEIIDRLGGFDESIFMYAEDLDLCKRINDTGSGVYYLASDAVIHYEGAGSSKKKDSGFLLLQNESNLYFMRKHHGPSYALAYRAAVFAGSLFRLAAAALATALRARRAGLTKKYAGQFLWAAGLMKKIRYLQCF